MERDNLLIFAFKALVLLTAAVLVIAAGVGLAFITLNLN